MDWLSTGMIGIYVFSGAMLFIVALGCTDHLCCSGNRREYVEIEDQFDSPLMSPIV